MNTLPSFNSESSELPKWQQPEKMAGRVLLLGLVGTR